ncbi:single-stranded DNA-binding protein [Paenibacillus sp. P2(2022)]|uniref:single-stranded DNA-binding protein n=1 Tax=Paenibacillus sp. P2(2022) TaxID=2917813 RepID=UPI0024054B87|nr:single-stranded DNA-binding protein [Paenibacillus sp. P2(2022)]MDG0056948.1 single-stranded DNA-binding protein [Paenibacillus sp. P2(2022)]
MSINRLVLVGRLTKDPELRYTPNGIATTTFTLAVDRPFTSQSGERETDFLSIVTWRQLAETCANYLKKGRLTAVEGRVQVRNYENSEGKRIYVTEIVADNVRFLEGNRDSQRDPNEPDHRRPYDKDPFHDDGKPIDPADLELPF